MQKYITKNIIELSLFQLAKDDLMQTVDKSSHDPAFFNIYYSMNQGWESVMARDFPGFIYDAKKPAYYIYKFIYEYDLEFRCLGYKLPLDIYNNLTEKDLPNMLKVFGRMVSEHKSLESADVGPVARRFERPLSTLENGLVNMLTLTYCRYPVIKNDTYGDIIIMYSDDVKQLRLIKNHDFKTDKAYVIMTRDYSPLEAADDIELYVYLTSLIGKVWYADGRVSFNI